MDIKARYSLAEFNDYAPAKNSLGFALLSHASFCTLKKSFTDENGERQRRRMVHVDLFRFIAAHESETREIALTYEKILIEIVINYIFFAGRELIHVKNEHRANMLADFAKACSTCLERREQEQDEELCKREDIEQNEEDQTRFRRNILDKSSKHRVSGIKTESSDDSSRIKLSF
ncbi:hypothetical protein G6011_04571 [Alternaria panax]|uniref:Uncharacterized protein n=1 Tax=Alternaria panax TaxID=48097 RepID=A0AAD4IHK0_9PLEO|nr:hypothetical protein G6011_04571 [Alternaria panax]